MTKKSKTIPLKSDDTALVDKLSKRLEKASQKKETAITVEEKLESTREVEEAKIELKKVT